MTDRDKEEYYIKLGKEGRSKGFINQTRATAAGGEGA